LSASIIIAIDAMGGDNAPACVVEGAHLALRRYSNVKFLLFGDKAKIEPFFTLYPELGSCCKIVHTDVAVAPHDKPSVALRRGAQSSMRLAIDAVKEGKADCIVSAGNTGALMAMAKLVFKTLPGISRPAIAGRVPTIKGDCVMLDLGANVECDAETLVQFAIMGDAFARVVLSLQSPKIGILNVGSEEMKGIEEVKKAAALLRNPELGLNFHGFVEGNDIGEGTVDVVVTDGFTGNVALKTAEGIGRMVSRYMRNAFNSSLLAKLGYLLAKPAMARLRKSLDPRRRNGAMFLGLNGIAIKSHGSADGYSFYFALRVAADLASNHINHKILEELKLSLSLAPAQAAAE
jgi:glycerol-3-phosphate acyltransferase PlsX